MLHSLSLGDVAQQQSVHGGGNVPVLPHALVKQALRTLHFINRHAEGFAEAHKHAVRTQIVE